MYKCPNGCSNEAFTRNVPATAVRTISADGTVTDTRYVVHNHEAGAVRCKCGARAEWIDARQVELFPIAPTLCA